MKTPYLSVVIPAYNEETNIRLGSLDKVSRYLERQSYTWEVILVNDGSTDATKTLLKDFIKINKGFSLIDNTHQGKAATVTAGMMAATGDIILFSDLDQATPLREAEKLLSWFEQGFDIVIGSRSDRREGAPMLRIFMARGFMILRNMLLGLGGIVDTQCGFKAFKNGVAKDIFHHLKLYSGKHKVSGSMVTAGFDVEVLFLAKKKKYHIKEVAVEWHYVETRRVNPITDSVQGFADIIRIRMNEWKGYYS